MRECDDAATSTEGLPESVQANALVVGDVAVFLDQPPPHGTEPDGHAAGPFDDELEEAIEEAG